MATKKLNCILLIDDNTADNQYHKTIIEEMNVTNSVEIAESGEEALVYLQEKTNVTPDLIFLDIRMPKMDGWEFMDEYRKLKIPNKSEIVIIMLSTSADKKDISRSQEIREVSNFETKPLQMEDIENIIDHFF